MSDYGNKDATYQAVGGEQGVAALVDCFYDIMSTKSHYQSIYDWHPDDRLARDKLARFLCGWMGGPRRYQEKYGTINIPQVHAHLPITTIEKDQWLDCMQEALEKQPYPSSLKKYLLEQLTIPANHVLRRCQAAQT